MSMEILDGNPPEEDELFSEKLKKVTPEEIEQLAQKVFKNDDHLIIILEEAERIDKEEDSKGSLVKLKEELQSNEKLQAK
ncbi:MAG: hypothetical protein NUV76_03380, partial [Candidatus Kuenenia sp.]|nr:hypothetical protein [Candidatus Kuenenia sp.]